VWGGVRALPYRKSVKKKKKQEKKSGGGGGGGGGDSHRKGLGMLIVSLRGIDQEEILFWSQGVHDKMPPFLTVKVSFRVHSMS